MNKYSLERFQGLKSSDDREEGRQVAVVSRTGDGSSSTANTILGREDFIVSCSSKSATKWISGAKCEYKNREIAVVDTPSVDSNTQQKSIAEQELARLPFLLRQGIHCIIICISTGKPRYTNEIEEMLKLIKMEGGDDIFHYCILVCTNAEIELQEFSLDDFLNEMRKDNHFGSFLDKIDERVVAVNNKTKSPEEKERNREAIIALVDKVVEENRKHGRAETCSNELFKQADKLHKTLVNKYRCHPTIVNAVIEATIKLTNSILRPNQNKFMSEVKTILRKNEFCKFDQKTQKFIFTNDGKCIEVSYDTFEQEINRIFSETRDNMSILIQFLPAGIGNRFQMYSKAKRMDKQTEWERCQQSLNHLNLPAIICLTAGYNLKHDEIGKIVDATNPGQVFIDLLKSNGYINHSNINSITDGFQKMSQEGDVSVIKDQLDALLGIGNEDDFETRMANYTYQRPLSTVRDYGIVLTGKTGCGKSSTGNSILGRKAFKSDASAKSVTPVASYATSEYGDRTLAVVDKPGVHDNDRSDSIVQQENARTAFLLREGVHCFIICMNASESRVTKETKQFLDAVKVSGHVDFFDYCMLVYTKPESALCDMSLNTFLEKQKENADMKSFLGKIGDRVLAVNNKATDKREKTRNKDAIIAMVDKVIENNMIKCQPIAFTNDTFKKAKELREKVVSVVKRENCHPSLVNAVIETVIWFSKWGTIAEEKFVEKVIDILCKSEQCENEGTKLVFRNDDEVITVPVVDCETHIKMIYKEIQLSIGKLYKLLGTILKYKKTYVVTSGALATGAGLLAGMTGIGAVGAILGVPAVIAYGIGGKMS
ncbi:GTPase IMAP family member 8-like isoform X2 [Apostichopus japonicus]